VKKKDEALEGRDSELTNLKSKRDGLAEQITQLELAIQQAKVDAANQAQQAEQAIEGLKVTISGLEAKLRETEEALHSKDLASQKLAEALNTEILDLQSRLMKKDEASESRDSEVNDLKSKREGLAEADNPIGAGNPAGKRRSSESSPTCREGYRGSQDKDRYSGSST
jgi:chromosome segregation ATPase